MSVPENIAGAGGEPQSLGRFYHCYDGLLRSVHVVYHENGGGFNEAGGETNAYLIISSLDSQRPVTEQWCNVHLDIHGVQEFRLTESGPKGGYEVLSGGIAVRYLSGLYFLDFTSDIDPEPELHSYTVDDFRRSEFYIAGRSFVWRTAPYGPCGP